MGADRLKDKKDNAKRGWNRAGERLLDSSEPTLFSTEATFARSSFRIMLSPNCGANVGDELLLHRMNESHIITRGPETIGECSELPSDLAEELRQCGTVCVEVIEVGAITNSIEVAPK